MKIPSRVWIKNEIYEVVYSELIDNPEDIGYCDDKKKILYIKLGLDDDTALDVFTHEFLHALCHLHKIKIAHKTLDKLATALAETITLNNC